MRIRRRRVAGLFAALLLLPVPAFAIQKSVARASRHVKINQTAGGNSFEVIQHEIPERRTYNAYVRVIRSQYRNADSTAKKTAEKYLKNLLAELRAHWKLEVRAGVVSPFDFPAL